MVSMNWKHAPSTSVTASSDTLARIIAHQTVFDTTSQKHACSAILKRLVKNPCRAPVACVLLNLLKRVVKYQALTNFSLQNLILDRCRFAEAGGNKSGRSQMVMSGWGKRSVIRIECRGNGSESCFVAARNRNCDRRGTNRRFKWT